MNNLTIAKPNQNLAELEITRQTTVFGQSVLDNLKVWEMDSVKFLDYHYDSYIDISRLDALRLDTLYKNDKLVFTEKNVSRSILDLLDLSLLPTSFGYDVTKNPHSDYSPIIWLEQNDIYYVISGNHRTYKSIHLNPDHYPIYVVIFKNIDHYIEITGNKLDLSIIDRNNKLPQLTP